MSPSKKLAGLGSRIEMSVGLLQARQRAGEKHVLADTSSGNLGLGEISARARLAQKAIAA